jgi:glycerol kinase
MTGRTAVLAIDQGTTNTKAVLVDADARPLAIASAPVSIASPRPGWAEQDAGEVWGSVLAAVRDCVAAAPGVSIEAVALSTQRESVVGWLRDSGRPIGPVLGWQDVRTTGWCAGLPASVDELVRDRTGLRVDAMFSAPKLRWLLGNAPASGDVCVGTVDAWLVWCLTGGAVHATEAGNASRTLLFDLRELDWSEELLAAFEVPRSVLPDVRASNAGFGQVKAMPGVPDGVPIVAVLADSHAALYAQGCTSPGMVKATYGTGSSVMTPTETLRTGDSPVPTTLAWQLDVARYAREGNIVSSGAALAWTANVLRLQVAELLELAGTVPDAGGVTLVPAFAGLGAPHWDREARASFTGMSNATTSAQLARAAVDAVAHQICDVVDVIEAEGTAVAAFRADGGATASELLMRTQADLLGHPVDVADVAELSALGAAQLAWETSTGSPLGSSTRPRRYEPSIGADERRTRRAKWAHAVRRATVH